MNKSGFNLLETKSLIHNSEIDYFSKENLFSIKIPPMLRLFSNIFLLNEKKITSEYFLTMDGTLEIGGGTSWDEKYNDKFENFLDCSFEEKNIWIDNNGRKYWTIASGYGSTLIGVGTGNLDFDKLIYIDDDLDIAENLNLNIFQFVRHFKFINNQTLELNHGSLFHNWDEDFWRLDTTKDLMPKDLQRYYQPIPRRGFSFIGTRIKQESNNVKIDLPLKLQTFLDYFLFEGKTGLNTEGLYRKSADEFLAFEKVTFSSLFIHNESIIIKELWNDSKFQNAIENFQDSPDWQSHQLISIGNTDKEYRIGVGILGEKSEEVWLVSDETPLNENGDLAIKLADDIFKFIRGLEPIYEEQYFDRIYKKWGESFWRFRENI